MKKLIAPQKPYHYFDKVINHVIISKTYVHPECIDRFTDTWEDQNEDSEASLPEINTWGYNEDVISLQEIIDKIPNNTPYDKVIFQICRERSCEHININVLVQQENNKDDWKKKCDIEDAQYLKDMEVFNIENNKYIEWERQQEIIQLEAKLAKLKK